MQKLETLESYLGGSWVSGSAPFAELVNPATETVLARASSEGLDFDAALAHARDTGGGELRALTFEARGALLERMSKCIHKQREALIELAVQNGGNTRKDAKFDIDGATQTLMAYAELGKKLGARRLLVDGEPTDLAGPRLQGWHAIAPRHGVAVHVGAFNFPTWGWAEKAACALLAGMPVVTKPATSTALVAERSVRSVIEAEILPKGALSLVCGKPGELLSRLGPQDVVAFTGGGDTGASIKRQEQLVRSGVRINVEADSLNAALLAPATEPATFAAFVRDVVRDMTQKAGQKCTAIRRVLVPEAQLERVQEALSDELARIKIGNPALDEVHMGPLATAAQKRDFGLGAARLVEQARVVFGELGRVEPLGVDAGRGFFVPLLLLRADDALSATAVHEHEVFGPLATLLGYDGSAENAARVVRAGQGSLVCSVYADDRAFLERALAGLMPWHGRIVIIDNKIADKAIAPGTVLPQLVHGGPGRAGGGEELGALRGLALYQQRTAVQGNGALIARLLG